MALAPHHAPFAEEYRRRGDWVSGSVPDALKEHAGRAPDRVALIDRQGAMTYGELDRAVRRFACALLTCGLGQEARIAIQLPNWREFVIAQQAALRIGAAYVPLLPQLREADVAHAIAASGAEALVVPAMLKDFDHAAMADTIGVPHVFVVGSSFEEAIAREEDAALLGQLERIAIHPDAPRTILFTSGSEAQPKGVLHSYNTQYFGLKRHVSYFNLTAAEIVMCVSPVGHGTGAVNGVELALHLGATIVLLEAWDPVAGLAAMARHGATLMWGATTFYTDLVRAARKGEDDLSAFTYAFTAGAPVPRELVGQVRGRLGATLIAAYGQSEGHNIAITRLDDAGDEVANSDGRFHAGIDWKLVDGGRNPVTAGERGEIAYRGPNVCLGYLDPAHNAAAFDAEGFIYSGDIGAVNAKGYLRIVGRAKDIIIRGGENISPAEVENILFGHPMIERLSVIGYADPRLGQRVCAIVVPKSGTRPQLADLTRYMAERKVAKFKFPEKVMLVDDMPMTASGKIRKAVLRELVEAEQA